jgi:hypothetical protein
MMIATMRGLGAEVTAVMQAPNGYVVGKPWMVAVQGAPDAAVEMRGELNGASTGTVSYGTTNANGQAWLTGAFQKNQVGEWKQEWYVGGQLAGSFRFTVEDNTTPMPVQQQQVQQQQVVQQVTQQVQQQQQVPVQEQVQEQVTQKVQQEQVPVQQEQAPAPEPEQGSGMMGYLMLAAIAVVGYMLLSGGGKK